MCELGHLSPLKHHLLSISPGLVSVHLCIHVCMLNVICVNLLYSHETRFSLASTLLKLSSKWVYVTAESVCLFVCVSEPPWLHFTHEAHRQKTIQRPIQAFVRPLLETQGLMPIGGTGHYNSDIIWCQHKYARLLGRMTPGSSSEWQTCTRAQRKRARMNVGCVCESVECMWYKLVGTNKSHSHLEKS